MHIESAHITEFGRLKDLDLDFSGGLNVIEGANESGKSTLAEFIKFIFYGLQSRKKGDIPSERERHAAWQSGVCAGHAVVNDENGSYRIERSCVRNGDSWSEKLTVVDLTNNTPVDIRDPGMRFFGMPESVFLRASYVRQTEGTEIDGEETARAIENMLYSADEDTNAKKALKKLDSARVRLKYKVGRGGEIYKYSIELEQKEDELEKARRASEEIAELESALEKSKEAERLNTERLGEVRRETAARSAKAALERYNKSEEQKKLAKEYLEKSEKLSEHVVRGGFSPDEEYIEELRRSRGELEYNRKELEREYHDDIGEIEHNDVFERISLDGGDVMIRRDAERAENSKRSFTNLSIITLIAGLIFGVIAYFMTGRDPGRKTVLLAVGGAIAALLVLFVILAVIKGVGVKRLYRKYSAQNSEDLDFLLNSYALNKNREELREAKRSQFQKEMDHASDREEHLLVKANLLLARWAMESDGTYLSTVDKLDEAVVTYEKIKETQQKLSNDRENALRVAEAYSPGKEFDPVSAQIAAGSSIPALEGDSDAELETKEKYAARAGEMLSQKISSLEKEIAVMSSSGRDPAMIESECDEIRGKIASLEKKYDAYVLAYDVLSEASSSLRKRISPALSRRAGEMMKKFTDGKYTSIGVSDALGLSFTCEDGGATTTHDVSSLSRGTQDAAYLALRMSLLEILGKNGSVPMIFDETFASLDDERLKNVLRALYAQTEQGSQIFLLTCRKREAEAAEECGEYRHIVL